LSFDKQKFRPSLKTYAPPPVEGGIGNAWNLWATQFKPWEIMGSHLGC